jgi:hypothetical protein
MIAENRAALRNNFIMAALFDQLTIQDDAEVLELIINCMFHCYKDPEMVRFLLNIHE